MKTEIIKEIEQSLLNYFDNAQMELLHSTLTRCLEKVEVVLKDDSTLVISKYSNEELINKFISAKEIEGCSKRTTKYYESTLLKMNSKMNKGITHMTTDDLRTYLTEYQKMNDCSKASVDNIRRNLSSFFSWLEEENYILKSPMKRIHKIKVDKVIKETYSDETLELLRDNCDCLRDLAIIDLLASTGMRVGELVKLNINDIDFENRECVVFGKGNKERPVYFDARTKIHLKNYLNSRNDSDSALFVSLDAPHERLNISGVEIRLRQLGKRLGIQKVHPHKFRRTVATKAIDKGMPIEQVQSLLGHSQIDTTMHYAMVNQNNVKESHRKYVA
ncbi:MAG: tyrosine-type recombinase/integrase [Solobacterium sp.]|nr:tyrosine-type recombinase/integrase [Solobacterium sp.]MCI7157336.1 tyrosine-type recombinase/integrase [Solobacterium sp.]MDY5401762.1 site-specific tyrosine recombinase/integron integrase [Erysipelotrichaceae bacterium]